MPNRYTSVRKPLHFERGESSGCTNRRRPLVHAILPSVGVDASLPLYQDCGDCTCVCRHCGATFWLDERVLRLSQRHCPAYTHCCKQGAVALPPPLSPPSVLYELLLNPAFMDNIRVYNTMFSITSFGAKVDIGVNSGSGPYVFKISGQICHCLGSLCPDEIEGPRFLQLYLYDTEHEVLNRMRFFRCSDDRPLDVSIVSALSEMLKATNGYVCMFKNAKDFAEEMHIDDFCIRIYANLPDSRYEPPRPGTLGCLVTGDDPNASGYDIILFAKSGEPQRVSRLHHSYMPLQYPLLFPFGESGWSPDLRSLSEVDGAEKNLTMNMYYSYLIHDRLPVFSHLLRCGRLFQQFLVDAYVCVEQDRLAYIRNHQCDLRSDYVSGILDAISTGDVEGRNVGSRIYLPASFVGGPRYMYKHYQDALAICRVFGNPQYFITFTCNVKWPEIVRFMDTHGGRGCEDRPDIIARVFHIKVQQFIKFVKQDKTFGDVSAYLYTIEFQKRGLPHCHSLLWVTDATKIHDAHDIDKYISAEFPDPAVDYRLYMTVTSCMIHGPCGPLNINSICMKNGKCRKRYPKPLNDATLFDKDGFVHYKRSSGVSHVMENGIKVDNGYVVPYNRSLSARFDAHINVEYCGWNMLIKYLFKYISKGMDRVCFNIQKIEDEREQHRKKPTENVDEINNFVEGRFICPHEASWRLLNFPIHERDPAVQVLGVHLENMQTATFHDNSELHNVANTPLFGKTTLTGWFASNRRDVRGRDLTYLDYPSRYRWDLRTKEWILRSRSGSIAVARLVSVHPSAKELFFLRMLLTHQKGCMSFSDIRTVADQIYPTYQQACEALGLIGEDREWQLAFADASSWASASQLRNLFCHLLLFCDVSNPLDLWENGWRQMSHDLSYAFRNSEVSPVFSIGDDLLRQQVLVELERLLNEATPSKSLADYRLPLPSAISVSMLRNRLLLEESCYDRESLHVQHQRMVSGLNTEQRAVYDKVVSSVTNKQQALIFVYGHGGTGKTFLWSTILSYFRSIGQIVLAVATSGIASLLLPCGRTAHSRFNIPLELSDQSTCSIKKQSHLAQLLAQTTLVVWDEATMTDRRCFECVDRTFRDILDNKTLPFGGISMLLGGDFRQTLPVKPKCSPSQIVASTLPYSYLWRSFSVFMLSTNMRLFNTTDNESAKQSKATFASWLLDVGNGNVGEQDSDEDNTTYTVQFPNSFLITNPFQPLQQLIDFVYPPSVLNNPSPAILSSRAIVCPKNETADEINAKVVTQMENHCHTYFSCDSVTSKTQRCVDLAVLFPQDFLNEMRFPGLPLHKLQLTINTPVMLLRNINQRLGLCNGTRLIVSQMLPFIIEATIVTGSCIGNRVYIPRIKFIYTQAEMPFIFSRKQFPLKVCYAMTINKSQGQSLEKVGLYLPDPVFGHGQLYVALSRATSPESLKVLLVNKLGELLSTTKNVVFKDLLKQLQCIESHTDGTDS